MLMEIMLMEIDQVAVDTELWRRWTRTKDVKARDEIRAKIIGLELYMHAMPVGPNETIVTLRQLDEANVIDFVTIGKPFTPGVVTMRDESGKEHTVHTRDDGER